MTEDTNDLAALMTDSLLLSSTTSVTLTGITPLQAGRKLEIRNNGTHQIILANESANSLPANRFHILGDELLEPDGMVEFEYDALTINRWRKVQQ